MTTSFQEMLGGHNPLKGVLSAPSHAQGADVIQRNSYRLSHADLETVNLGGMNVDISQDRARGAGMGLK